MNQWNYELMKMIKKQENRRTLKLYFSKIFDNLSSDDKMTKYSFICYIND